MQKTAEHARMNRVLPATVDLLIHESNKGMSLRRLGSGTSWEPEHDQVVIAWPLQSFDLI
jgi:hypothetical protein